MTDVFDSGCGLCRLAEGVASRVKKLTSWKLEQSSINALNRTTEHKTDVLTGKELVVTASLDTGNVGAGDNWSDENIHVPIFLQHATYFCMGNTLHPGDPCPWALVPSMTRAQTTETQTLLLCKLYPGIVGHNLGALKRAVLPVTSKLVRRGNFLGRSVWGLLTRSLPPILRGREGPGGWGSRSQSLFRSLHRRRGRNTIFEGRSYGYSH